MGCGGGCGGRERSQQPAEEQSARSARRRPLGEGGRKDGRTDGPTGRASSSHRPPGLLTTSLPAVLAAAAASRCTQGSVGASGLVSTPAPGRSWAAAAASCPLPPAGGGTALAPRFLRPVPQPHPLPPRSQLCHRARLTRAALTREAAPSALRAAAGSGGSSGLRGRPGRCCSADRELETGGGGR